MSTNEPPDGLNKGNTPRTRAAAYVRMSTEHQQYSTENQIDVIREYAKQHNIDIIRLATDEGKSGLRLDGRDSLKKLIADVNKPDRDFDVILVYDVSRWGRFQDTDESAHYEYVCRLAGAEVQYCAEQFKNDGSAGSNIIKTVKREMAAEYSRELSVKVFQGQCRLIQLGYRQGGPAGYGLRRMLVDQSGKPKGRLSRGQQKSIQTDRVILILGPPEEVEIVRWIYQQFALEGKAESEIAQTLNDLRILTDFGRPWTRATVHQVLTNEKYIGNNVYNRVSFKLKMRRERNPSEKIVRLEDAFEPIVDRDLFERAQQIIAERSRRFTDQELLEWLTGVYQERGKLSALIIDEYENGPSSSVFRNRFGSLIRSYRLVGYVPDHDYTYLEINRRLRAIHPQVLDQVTDGIAAGGGAVAYDEDTGLLTVNDEFTISVVIARCKQTSGGSFRWIIRLDTIFNPDITVAVRMDHDNVNAMDYYVLPSTDISGENLRLGETNGLFFDSYRFDDLDYIIGLTRRVHVMEMN